MERLAADPAETRIVLRHEGEYVGQVVNARWLERPCRNRRCQRDGCQTVHIWDLLTGRMRTEDRPLPPPRSAPPAAAHDTSPATG